VREEPGHRAQAFVMAGRASTHDAGPSVRTPTERVIDAQQDEIVTAQQWPRDRGVPVPEARASRSVEWIPGNPCPNRLGLGSEGA
jgi:hypothetical protein